MEFFRQFDKPIVYDEVHYQISLCLAGQAFKPCRSPIDNFGFIIGLRMPYQSKLLSNAAFLAKLVELHTIELLAIIHDNHLGKIVSTNNEFLDEVSHPSFSDMCKRFSFDLLDKKINGY